MRPEQTLIGNMAYGGMGANTAIANLGVGGQFGWSPDLSNRLSDQGYVRKPLELRVIQSPRLFSLMPDPQKWESSFRNMIERKVIRAEGWADGLTVETDDHAAGGAGEMFQEPVNVTRARSEPVLTYVDPYGRPIFRMHDLWIRYGIMDPETKFAMLTTLGARSPSDLMADWYSATILAFEPDPIRGGVEKAWLTTNFYPLETGESTGMRDLAASSELSRPSIRYAGTSVVGNGIKAFATEIMNFTSLDNADPFNKACFIKEIAPDVLAAAEAGFQSDVQRTAASNVMPIA